MLFGQIVSNKNEVAIFQILNLYYGVKFSKKMLKNKIVPLDFRLCAFSVEIGKKRVPEKLKQVI